MDIKLFSALIPRVSPSVPGCPQPVMISHIRTAAISCCERTSLWRYTQPTFALMPGVHEYDYAKPVETDVHVLFDAMMNDLPLGKLTLEQALNAYPAWADLYGGVPASVIWDGIESGAFNSPEFDEYPFNSSDVDANGITLPAAALADSSTPRSVCQLTPDKYVVLPQPDDSQTYTMRMFYALKPKRDASGMSQQVMDELEDVIVHAALQQLLLIPNTVWNDSNLASYHAKQCLFLTTERRARANLGNMRGTLTAASPKFA